MYQPDKLKQKREELCLEQQELAEHIGVSKQATLSGKRDFRAGDDEVDGFFLSEYTTSLVDD